MPKQENTEAMVVLEKFWYNKKLNIFASDIVMVYGLRTFTPTPTTCTLMAVARPSLLPCCCCHVISNICYHPQNQVEK